MLGRPWPAPGEPLFSQEDTAWALALHEQEAAEAADRCLSCGLPREQCRAKANQFRFVAEPEQCHATYAIAAAQSQQAGDDVTRRATTWSARLKT